MPRDRCPVPGHEHEDAHNCRCCAADRLVEGARDLPPAPEPHGRDLAAGKDD